MQQPNINKYDLNIPIWLMKDFSFNKKGTLQKRGVSCTQRTSSRYAPVVFVVFLNTIDCCWLVFIFISKLSCCFVWLVFVSLALCAIVYILFIIICSLFSRNKFLYSIRGMLPWLFLFTFFSFRSQTNLSPYR